MFRKLQGKRMRYFLTISLGVFVAVALVAFFWDDMTTAGAPTPEQIERSKELILFQEGKLWGFRKLDGTVVIEPKFRQAMNFSDGVAWVTFDSRERSQAWGLINADGEWVVTPGYRRVRSFAEGFARVRRDSKTSYINASGKLVIPWQGEEPVCHVLNRKLHWKQGDKWAVFDSSGKKIAEKPLRDLQGLRNVRRYARSRGYENLDGELIIPNVFSNRQNFTEGFAAVAVEGRWGFIDVSGNYLVKPQFEKAWPFYGGLARVQSDGKVGFIDSKGKVVIHPQFDFVGRRFCDNLCPARQGDKCGYIGREGRWIISSPQFRGVGGFSEGLAPAAVKNDSGELRWGYINIKGEFVIKPQFDRAGVFSNHSAQVRVATESKRGLKLRNIDAAGSFLTPLYGPGK